MIQGADPEQRAFPRGVLPAVVIVGVTLVVGGIGLWWPSRGSASTANSDLGLALLSGGLAVSAAFLVARVVFVAERRFDAALRASEESRAQDTFLLTLSMAPSLDGADLHERDLTRAFLRGKHMRHVNLKRSRLDGADLTDARLERALLDDASLSGCMMARCRLQGARLVGADLSDANLDAANLSDAALRAANLRGADLENARLIRTNLRRANLQEANLRGARLLGADLSETRLAATHVVDATFNDETRWPAGFDAINEGARRVDTPTDAG